MSNITVQHATSGLVQAEVAGARRITPHMVRVTLTGASLADFVPLGFDQWMRLAIPVRDETRFDNLSPTFGLKGYLRYMTLPKGTRPVIRNYTVREFRRNPDELDIDFVVNGDDGIAGPWAASVQPGVSVPFIDQGCGWRPVPADWNLLVTDESGLPAVAGILRDMPREAKGIALIELFDEADRQETGAPDGVEARWLLRDPGNRPGGLALSTLTGLEFPPGTPYAFAVGEQALASGVRRHLVAERGVPKGNVTFSGYWRVGKAAPGA